MEVMTRICTCMQIELNAASCSHLSIRPVERTTDDRIGIGSPIVALSIPKPLKAIPVR